MKYYLILLSASVIFSCKLKYYVNEHHGVRPTNPDMFSYKKRTSLLTDTLLIDTNSIYVKTPVNAHPFDKEATEFYRFWANGRVLKITTYSKDLNTVVNNTQTGIIGYYHIKKGRLKMQMLEMLNGGQVGLRYGLFENGDISFHQARPETWYGSWALLEALGGDRRTWHKTKLDSIKPVKANW